MTLRDTEQRSSATPIRALARVSRDLAMVADPVQALWKLVCAVREDLRIDRAGVFAFDRTAGTLERVAGVDQTGQAEYGGQCFQVTDAPTPLMQVARREFPYYFTEDAPRDFPEARFAPGVRAHAIIPILAGDELMGTLCVDNCLSGDPIPEQLLEPLFLAAGLAALPLFALYQAKERERVEAMRWHIYRDVLSAVTSGKMLLCNQDEIRAEWPSQEPAIDIAREEDVRVVREAARKLGQEAGMQEERAMDLALCASEAATNALLHGNGGIASVGTSDGRLRVRITDHGEGIDPEDLPRATLLKGWSKRASMGLGFTLMNETADRVLLHTGRNGTTIIVEMAVEPEVNLPEECNPLLWGEDLSLLQAGVDELLDEKP